MALAPSAAVAAERPSSTMLPDGVTWADVRGYIDANLTGSKVFADAVYDAIRASGQDYRDLEVAGDYADSAADVVTYFGADAPNTTVVTVTKPLEDNAVLTGVTLLDNVGRLEIKDVGKHIGLAFIEDAFAPAADGRPAYETSMGPAIDVAPMNLTTLPKRPYTYNLTRARSGHHSFNTTAYNDLSVAVVRDPKGGDIRIDIDTLLTGRGAAVDLGATMTADGRRSQSAGPASSTDPAPIRPTALTPTFGAWGRETGREDTKRVTAKGNVITMSIPSCGADGDYRERVVFDNVYNHFGNTAVQRMSLDYLYRTNVTYLSTVNITGKAVVLGDVKARKVDASTGDPLGYGWFKLYEDKAGTKPARQADVGPTGAIRRDQAGNIVMKDVGAVAADEDGTVLFQYLKPGDYYLAEIAPPTGYGVADPNPIKVTVKGADKAIPGPTVSGGQGSEAKVPAATNSARVDDFRNASSWHTATNNMTLTSKPRTVRVPGGVYVRNGGKPVEIKDFGAVPGLTLLGESGSAGGYDVTFGTGDGAVDSSGDGAGAGSGQKTGPTAETKRFATAAAARDAINTMIKGKRLTCATAAIGIDAGERVYHRAATDADVVTVKDPPLPVHLRASATKTLTSGGAGASGESGTGSGTSGGSAGSKPVEFEDGRFKFTLDGADSRGKVHETVGAKGSSAIAATGVADFGTLTFDKAGSYEFTVTEEIDGSDTSVSYNPEGVSYRLWVDVEPDWLGKFKADGSRAESDAGGSGGSGSAGTPSHRTGLAAVVHAAKVTTGKDGRPVVGRKEFIGTFSGTSTNTAVKGENGAITGFTPSPWFLNATMRFSFTNVVKDTTLPRTGSGGLTAIAASGVALLVVGVLVACHASRRRARL